MRVSAVARRTLPSDRTASATTCWSSARRMRVCTSARASAGVKWKLAMPGVGLRVASRWMRTTWSAGVIGLSTATVSGTWPPFSAVAGRRSAMPPSSGCASPISSRIAASSEDAACAPKGSAASISSKGRRAILIRTCP